MTEWSLRLLILLAATVWMCCATTDMLIIRHGRSRVRHSSVKDHIRWGLKAFDNLTLSVDYANETLDTMGGGNDLLYSNGSSGERIYGYTTPEYQMSKATRMEMSDSETNTFVARTTPAKYAISNVPKKLLGKKQIMANIRKTVDKGLEYIKTHAQQLNQSPPLETSSNPMPSQSNFRNKLPFKITSTSSAHKTDVDKYGTEAKGIAESISNSQLNSVNSNQYRNENSLENISLSVAETKITNSQLKTTPVADDVYVGGVQRINDVELTMGNANQFENNNIVLNNSTAEELSGINVNEEQTLNDEQIISESVDYGAASSSLPISGIYSDITDSTDDDNEFKFGNEVDLGNDFELVNGYDNMLDLNNGDDLEESRRNRLDLMRGHDILTNFLQIVESQHLLGANCTAGTSVNLGDRVVDRYAQDRFRVEAEVAVNRANMLTRYVYY